jgi:cytohesin
MKIPCSNCNQRLEIPDEFAGQTIECPACKASLAVPAMAAPPPASAQVQESAPQIAPSRKSKSTMSKLLVASVVGVAVVVLMLIVFGGPRTPSISIHEAAKDGNIEAVKQHLIAGTDPNFEDEFSSETGNTNFSGTTPLHVAAGNGHKEIAEFLISEGANVNALSKLVDKRMKNSPMGALEPFNEPIEMQMSPLDLAIGNDHKEMVELLIANGAELDGGESGRPIPLMAAIMKKDIGRKNIEIVELLLNNGANLNAEITVGQTPLRLAINLSKHTLAQNKIARLLIEKGADVNAKTKSGSTLLHVAAGRSNREIVELLINKGLDVNAKTRGSTVTGHTPLNAAAAGGQLETVELLIAKGADVHAKIVPLKNAKPDTGRTLLHSAAVMGHEEIVELLIAKGLDVNAKESGSEFTPLHKATLEGHTYVVELLIAKGSNVNAKDENGKTPLNWVRSSEHPDIAALLRKHGGKTRAELKAEGK